MLKSMRKNAKYFYILFLIVIITFIFWGVGRTGGNKNDQGAAVVASIGGDRITLSQYWRVYERTENALRDAYGEKFDDKMREALKMKVLDQMVTEAMLGKAAVEAGLTVTDSELSDAITSNPNFRENNVFSREVYLRTLQLNRITPGEYESTERRQLLVDKMRRVIEDPVELSPAEMATIPQAMAAVKGVNAGNPDTQKMLQGAILNEKRQRALVSYIEGLRKQMHVTVNPNIIS